MVQAAYVRRGVRVVVVVAGMGSVVVRGCAHSPWGHLEVVGRP